MHGYIYETPFSPKIIIHSSSWLLKLTDFDFRSKLQAPLDNGSAHITCIKHLELSAPTDQITCGSVSEDCSLSWNRRKANFVVPQTASSKYFSSTMTSIWIAFLICCSGILMVRSADQDPLVDVSPNAGDSFVLRDVFTNGNVSNGPGGLRAALNINIFPALTNEGITYVQFMMKPCGENLPHTHPRATEILTLVSGGPLQAGLVDTSGTPHIYILNPGDIIVFPRGLLHYELNVGAETAFYISALNSQNPGVLTSGGALLALPERALAGALNQDIGTVDALKKQIFQYSDKLQLDMSSACVPGRDITPDW